MSEERQFRVTSADARLIRIPVDPPAGDASNCFDVQEIILCEVRDGAGHLGRGFGYTIGRGGSTVLEFLKAELLPRLIGRDSRWIAHVGSELKKCVHTVCNGTLGLNALAAIDIALWDLAGIRTDTPVHLLLGGAKREVPVYNTDVGWLSWSLDELVERCRHATASGKFQAVKLKVGSRDPAEDVARVAKVREAVGSKVKIMSDANNAWTVDEAIRRLRALEPFGLTWIEEPLKTVNRQLYVELKQHTPIAIAGGESLSSPADFYEFARHGAFDILQPDVARLGGITPALQVCALASAAGLRVAPHVSPELSVVVAAATANSFFVEFIPQMEPILKHGLAIENGMARVSDRPGIGIEFDEDALRKYEVASHAVAA